MSLVSSLKPFYLLRDFSADLPMSEICVKVFHFFSTAALTLCSKRGKNVYLEHDCRVSCWKYSRGL